LVRLTTNLLWLRLAMRGWLAVTIAEVEGVSDCSGISFIDGLSVHLLTCLFYSPNGFALVI